MAFNLGKFCQVKRLVVITQKHTKKYIYYAFSSESRLFTRWKKICLLERKNTCHLPTLFLVVLCFDFFVVLDGFQTSKATLYFRSIQFLYLRRFGVSLFHVAQPISFCQTRICDCHLGFSVLLSFWWMLQEGARRPPKPRLKCEIIQKLMPFKRAMLTKVACFAWEETKEGLGSNGLFGLLDRLPTEQLNFQVFVQTIRFKVADGKEKDWGHRAKTPAVVPMS